MPTSYSTAGPNKHKTSKREAVDEATILTQTCQECWGGGDHGENGDGGICRGCGGIGKLYFRVLSDGDMVEV